MTGSVFITSEEVNFLKILQDSRPQFRDVDLVFLFAQAKAQAKKTQTSVEERFSELLIQRKLMASMKYSLWVPNNGRLVLIYETNWIVAMLLRTIRYGLTWGHDAPYRVERRGEIIDYNGTEVE